MAKRRGDDWDEVFSLLTDLSEVGTLEKKVDDRALEEQVARHAGAVKRLDHVLLRLVADHDGAKKALEESRAEATVLRDDIARLHKELADAKGRLASARGGVAPTR
jgi:hypothetical protein